MMELRIDRSFFSWFSTYNVYEYTAENLKKTVFFVKGDPKWGECLKVFNADSQEAAEIRISRIKNEDPFDCVKAELFTDGNYIGGIIKKSSFFTVDYQTDLFGWKESDRTSGEEYNRTYGTNFRFVKYNIVNADGKRIVAAREGDSIYDIAYTLKIDDPGDAFRVVLFFFAQKAIFYEFHE